MAKRNSEARWIEKAQRWQCNVTNDDGERKTFVCNTPGKKGKLAAERKADEWLENGTKDGSIRVSAAFDEFIEHIKGQGTSETYWEPYVSIGRTWIKPYLGAKKVLSLSENQLEGILQKAASKGLAEKTIKNIRACIMAFLKYCRKSKLTTLHPEELVIPKGCKSSEKFTLTESEYKLLMTSDKTMFRGKVVDEWYIHAYRFAILMGYRPGELAGIQEKDINGDIITISRGISDKGKLTNLKNKNAKRTKKINSLAMKELEAQRIMLKKKGVISPWMFPQPDGTVIDHNTYRRTLKRYFEYNGIGKRTLANGEERYITPYEFRHTWVSVNDDMPDGLKKRAAGWSKSFDGDTYNHQLKSDAERIANFEDSKFKALLDK